MLLDNSGESGPYLLVGHSPGGFNVRVFAGRYPQDVEGMVLVDADEEDEESALEALSATEKGKVKEAERSEKVEEMIEPREVNFGVDRLRLATGWDRNPYLPKELQQELRYLNQQAKARRAVASEIQSTPIPFEHPDVVVKAIREVWNEVNTK